MLQHVVDCGLDAQPLAGERAYVISYLIPHLLAQAPFGQTYFLAGAIIACPVASFVTGTQQVAHAAIGPLVVHMIVGAPVGDGEFGSGATCLALAHPLLHQCLKGRVVQCQEFFIPLLAQHAAVRCLIRVIHGKKDEKW